MSEEEQKLSQEMQEWKAKRAAMMNKMKIQSKSLVEETAQERWEQMSPSFDSDQNSRLFLERNGF